MSSGLQASNPTIVAAFHSALARQGLVVLGVLAVLLVAWNVLRASQLRRAVLSGTGESRPTLPSLPPEPVARRVVRAAFGLLWLLDGLLQAQSSMPLGLPSEVIQPGAASSPGWVRHLVAGGAVIWSNHPVAAAAATVWIQVGLGLFLLAAPRGYWSRLAGLSSAVWGVIVWIFGESFGGIFAPGLTFLFGAPGAVVFYVAGGALVALPEQQWSSPRLGRRLLRAMGPFVLGMGVLQAWPGRGFWTDAKAGTLATMARQMSQTSQPSWLAGWVRGFAGFDAAHGFAVNLVVVIALGLIGAALVTARPQLVRPALGLSAVVCLAAWVLVEDLGFLGGVGTDPNSMIPFLVLLATGYVAVVRVPSVVDTEAPVPISPEVAAPPSWRDRLGASPSYAFRSLAALVAIAIVLVGAVPMALASTNPNADPIIAQAIDGSPDRVDIPVPPFSLTDQTGGTVTLQSLRGKVVALTFLDPVCVSDCPLIAQELRQADGLLGAEADKVELVAVVVNPLYRSRPYLVAFDRQEGLEHLANWRFLTGSLPALGRLWGDFGVQVAYSPGGAMVGHSDIAAVIDAAGHTRFLDSWDPGPGTSSSKSSFAVTLVDEIESVLGS